MRACEQGGATSQTIEFDFDYTRWVGQSVRSLPYFDKLHRYFDALKRGWDGSWSLEVEGRTILSGTTGDIGQSAVVSEEYAKLDYIRCVRELLELWKIDVPMLDVPVSWREISMVCKLWSLLCELPRKRNAELSSGNLVQSWLETYMKPKVCEFRRVEPTGTCVFARKFDDLFNLLGTAIAVNLLNVHYSAVTLRTNDSPSKIRPGESFNLDRALTSQIAEIRVSAGFRLFFGTIM